MLLVLVASGGFPIEPDSLNDLIVFLTMYLRTGHENRLKIVQGLSVVFDSEKSLEEELADKLLYGFNSEVINSTCSDFGYALLLVQKEKRDSSKILLFAGEKVSLKFVKCVFTARKLDIHVDCIVSKDGFVSQISDILKRSAFCISTGESLFEYLLGILSVDFGRISRKTSQRFCICHGQEIKTGYLCPICLGLYCKFVPLCRSCKTRFIF